MKDARDRWRIAINAGETARKSQRCRTQCGNRRIPYGPEESQADLSQIVPVSDSRHDGGLTMTSRPDGFNFRFPIRE